MPRFRYDAKPTIDIEKDEDVFSRPDPEETNRNRLIKLIDARLKRAERKLQAILPNPYAESISTDINIIGAVKTFLEFDAYYTTTSISTPPTNVRYVWVDTADGHIKVRKSDGTDVDLETGGAAAASAAYLVLALDASLSSERRFVPGTALSAVDGGVNGDYTLNHASISTGDLHTQYFLADGTRDITGAFDIDKAVGVLFTGSVTGSARMTMQHDRLQFGTGGAMDTEWTRQGANQWTTPDAIGYNEGSLVLVNGANSNVDISTSGVFLRITGPTAAFNVTGFTNGYAGRRLIIYNSAAQDMTLTNDATSTAANRILTLTGVDVTLTGVSSAHLVYSSADSRWILIGTQG